MDNSAGCSCFLDLERIGNVVRRDAAMEVGSEIPGSSTLVD